MPGAFWEKIVQSKEKAKALRTVGSWHADGWKEWVHKNAGKTGRVPC